MTLYAGPESVTVSDSFDSSQMIPVRELTSCLCSTAALADCFEGCLASLKGTETGNELSQCKFQFTSLYHGETQK